MRVEPQKNVSGNNRFPLIIIAQISRLFKSCFRLPGAKNISENFTCPENAPNFFFSFRKSCVIVIVTGKTAGRGCFCIFFCRKQASVLTCRRPVRYNAMARYARKEGFLHVQNFSAQKAAPQKRAWFSEAHGHVGRTQGAFAPQKKGKDPPVLLKKGPAAARGSESRFRRRVIWAGPLAAAFLFFYQRSGKGCSC